MEKWGHFSKKLSMKQARMFQMCNNDVFLLLMKFKLHCTTSLYLQYCTAGEGNAKVGLFSFYC